MNVLERIEDSIISINLSRIASRLSETKVREYMISKLPNISRTANPNNFLKFISELLKYQDGANAVKKNFEKIKKGCFENKFRFRKTKVSAGVTMFFDFIENLKDVPELQEEYELYGYFLKLYNSIDLEKSKDFDSASYITKLRERVFKRILNSKYSEEMKAVIDYISQKDGDFKFYAVGGTTLVFKTNTQVIKLGIKEDFKVPYHPRLMMPYFRKQYETGVSLEVFNFADAKSAENISDEQLLEIYKELENDGIFWGDAKKNNLFFILKPNKVPNFIVSKDFNVFGFIEDSRFPTTNHKELPVGSLLIGDLDYIYPIDDPNRTIGNPARVIREYWDDQRVKREVELFRGIAQEREGDYDGK